MASQNNSRIAATIAGPVSIRSPLPVCNFRSLARMEFAGDDSARIKWQRVSLIGKKPVAKSSSGGSAVTWAASPRAYDDMGWQPMLRRIAAIQSN